MAVMGAGHWGGRVLGELLLQFLRAGGFEWWC